VPGGWEGRPSPSNPITGGQEVAPDLNLSRTREYRCHQGRAPVTAPAPPRLIPGGRYSLEFAVYVALMKYGFHLSLVRQQRL